jgi:hypothetical protein
MNKRDGLRGLKDNVIIDCACSSWCRTPAADPRKHPDVGAAVPVGHVAVQCTHFEKSVGRNWLVPVHQDLSISVRNRVAHRALCGWLDKELSVFVQPQPELIEQLVAVRVHHRCPHGRRWSAAVRIGDASAGPDRYRASQPPETGRARRALCRGPGQRDADAAADADASSKAGSTSRRRVLHFVFGQSALPYGLL